MAQADKVLLRGPGGSGFLVDRKDVKRFMQAYAGYSEESPEETKANQAAADAEVGDVDAAGNAKKAR